MANLDPSDIGFGSASDGSVDFGVVFGTSFDAGVIFGIIFDLRLFGDAQVGNAFIASQSVDSLTRVKT